MQADIMELTGLELLADLKRRARAYKARLHEALDDLGVPAPDVAERHAILGQAVFEGERWGRSEARRLGAERIEALQACAAANVRFKAAEKARITAIRQLWTAQDEPDPMRGPLVAQAREKCHAAQPEFAAANKEQHQAFHRLAIVDSQLAALGARDGLLPPGVAGKRESDRWRREVEECF